MFKGFTRFFMLSKLEKLICDSYQLKASKCVDNFHASLLQIAESDKYDAEVGALPVRQI